MSKFNVYVWWGSECDDPWRQRFRNVPHRKLRDRIRRLRNEGWGWVSMFVESTDPKRRVPRRDSARAWF